MSIKEAVALVVSAVLGLGLGMTGLLMVFGFFLGQMDAFFLGLLFVSIDLAGMYALLKWVSKQ